MAETRHIPLSVNYSESTYGSRFITNLFDNADSLFTSNGQTYGTITMDFWSVKVSVSSYSFIPETNFETRLPKDFALEGSNNNLDWDILDVRTGIVSSSTITLTLSTPTNYYRYLRLVITSTNSSSYISMQEFKIYGTQIENKEAPILLMPIMNGYNNGNITVFDTGYGYSHYPWHVFDRDLTQIWAKSSSPWILAYDYGSNVKLDIYSITSRTDGYLIQSPKNWSFEGSNNNIDWTIIDIRTNEINWMLGETRFYNLNNTVEFRYYRLNITENNGDPYTAISEHQIYYKPIPLNKKRKYVQII